jgi:hypothetical protein
VLELEAQSELHFVLLTRKCIATRKTSSCAIRCEGWAVVTWCPRACRVTESRQATTNCMQEGNASAYNPRVLQDDCFAYVQCFLKHQTSVSGSCFWRFPPFILINLHLYPPGKEHIGWALGKTIMGIQVSLETRNFLDRWVTVNFTRLSSVVTEVSLNFKLMTCNKPTQFSFL